MAYSNINSILLLVIIFELGMIYIKLSQSKK